MRTIGFDHFARGRLANPESENSEYQRIRYAQRR
jgi:hypothetical protein